MAESSERLRELINQYGINQTEFAERLNLPKSTVSQYFNGKRKPKQNILTLIANKFKVNEAWLMGYDVPMEIIKLPDPAKMAELTLNPIVAKYAIALLDLPEEQRTLVFNLIEQLLKKD